ncbi:hypothetical protein MRX96_039191, partial [Rhipicephalus microplus]
TSGFSSRLSNLREATSPSLCRPQCPGGRARCRRGLSSRHCRRTCGVAEVRVNHRQNIVAVDATTRKGLEELLAISELQSIPVTAKEPADLRTSTGYLHGADRGPEVGSLLPGLLSTMIVLSDTREGHTVTLLFGVPFPQSRDLGFLQQAKPPQGGHQSSALLSPVSRRTSQMPRGLSSRRRSTGPQLSRAPPAASPRLSFVQALSSHPGVAEIRVNHRQNIVAVDATTRKGLEKLLAISELQSIPVTAKEPADVRTSTGYLHGADRGPEVGTLLPGLLSTMIVLSDTRMGHTVTLLFGVPFPQSRLSRLSESTSPAPCRPQCRGGPARCRGAFPEGTIGGCTPAFQKTGCIWLPALSSRPGVGEIRANHRQNIVAVDATTRKGLEELLAISELQSIPVTAKEPADLRTRTGYQHGADRGPEVGTLLPGLLSTMIVLSDTREGHTVTLLFGVPFPQSK